MRMNTRLKRGVPLSPTSQKIICNVYRYFVTEALKFKRSYSYYSYFNKVQERVVDATGISRSSLKNVLNERDRQKCEEEAIKKNNMTDDVLHLRKKRMTDDYQTREIINNVFGYITIERDKFKTQENGYFEKVQKRVAKATGISRSCLITLFNEIKETGIFSFNSSKLIKRTPLTDTEKSDKFKTEDTSQAIEFLTAVHFSSESDNESRMSDSDPEYILGLS